MLTKKTIIGISITILFILLVYFIGCHADARHFCLYDTRQEKLNLMIKKVAKELDLNKSQVQLLKNIKNEIQKKHTVLKEKQEDSFNTFITEIKSEKLNEQKINQLWDQKVELVNEMRPIVIAKFVEFHSTLTQEQREKLVNKITDIHNQHDHK